MLKSAARVAVTEPAASRDRLAAITKLCILPSSNTVWLFGTPNPGGINRKPNVLWIRGETEAESSNAVAGSHRLGRRLPIYLGQSERVRRRCEGFCRSSRAHFRDTEKPRGSVARPNDS